MVKEPIGKVLALYISDGKNKLREDKKHLSLDKQGVIGDKFYDKDISRSVLISSQASYTLAKEHDIHLPGGALGENIMIDYNPYHLEAGTQFLIGNTILRISQNCTICEHLSHFDKRLPRLLKKDRGIFAQVIQDGDIQLGDTIYLLKELS